jgi:hypothetical protein
LPELDKILVKEYESQGYEDSLDNLKDSLCNSTIQTNIEIGNISILNTQMSE